MEGRISKSTGPDQERSANYAGATERPQERRGEGGSSGHAGDGRAGHAPNWTVSEEESGYNRPGSGEPCTCGFCDSVEVTPWTDVDPATGEERAFTFEKPSTRLLCPVCWGYNRRYRSSYVAHVASTFKGFRPAEVYDLTVVLDTEAADRADIDGADSWQVWTAENGPWKRFVRKLRDLAKSRTGEPLQYVGSLSGRKSDGRAHFHGVIRTGLSVQEMKDAALHVEGLGVYQKKPLVCAANESAEEFAARRAAYAWDNAARSSSSRFVASNGAGYFSKAAKQSRREHVERQEPMNGSDPFPRAQNLMSTMQRARGQREGQREAEATRSGSEGAPQERQEAERAPPVACPLDYVPTEEAHREAVAEAIKARLGSYAPVEGLGPRKLLAGTYYTVFVSSNLPCGFTVVPWSRIVGDFPLIREHSRSSYTHRAGAAVKETQEQTETAEEELSPVERFNAAAYKSKFTEELPDGRRRVTEKNFRTGEVTERILPPR